MSYILIGIIVVLSYLLYQSKTENHELKGLLSRESDESESKGVAINDLSDEDENLFTQEAEKVRVLCKIAECHLENLSDEYECKKLNERIDKAIVMAKAIPDEFYSFSALGFVIKLAHDAGLEDKKQELLNEINDPMILDMVQGLIDGQNA